MKTFVLIATICMSGCLAPTEWDNPHDPESDNFTVPFHIVLVPEGSEVMHSRLTMDIRFDDESHVHEKESRFRCTLNDETCIVDGKATVDNDGIVVLNNYSGWSATGTLVVPTLGPQVLRLQPIYDGHVAKDRAELSWTRIPVDTSVSFSPDPYGGVIRYGCLFKVTSFLPTKQTCQFYCALNEGPWFDCATIVASAESSYTPLKPFEQPWEDPIEANVLKAIDILPSATTSHVFSVAASIEGALDPTPAKITLDCVQYGKEAYDFYCSGPGDEPFKIGQPLPLE